MQSVVLSPMDPRYVCAQFIYVMMPEAPLGLEHGTGRFDNGRLTTHTYNILGF